MAKSEKEQEKQAVSQSGGAAPVRADSISTELDELVTVVLEVWGRGVGQGRTRLAGEATERILQSFIY